MTFHSQQRYSYPWGFRNSDAGVLPGMSIASITGFEFKDNELIAVLAKPSTTFSTLFAVTEPVDCAAGGYGRCARTGIVPVKYDASGTPSFNLGWGFKPSQWTISLGFYGCTACKVLDSTEKIVAVELNPIIAIMGKAVSISARSTTTPGTGTFEVWYNNNGTLTDGGFSDITVKNHSATAPTAGDFLQAKLIAGSFWVDFEDCP